MTENITEVPEAVTVTFPAYKLDEAVKKFDKANRRLEAAGVSARFTYETEAIEVNELVGATELLDPLTGAVVERIGGTMVKVPYIVLTLTSPLTLTVGDFTFVASLIAEEAGMTVHTAPGQSLEGWVRPAADDDHCDHCGTDRRRTRLYVVRNNVTGELVQVGHSCIELYLGSTPKALWSLEFPAELRGWASEEGGSFSPRDYGVEVDVVLATAFAYSDQGRSYVSTARASEWGPTATVAKVRSHIFEGAPRRANFGRDEQGYQKALAEYTLRAEQITAHLADTALLDAIKASAQTVKAGSDYGDNLRIILAGESGVVRDRNVGILASLVSVYAREQQLVAERAAAPVKVAGFLGEVKERIRNFSITLTNVKVIDGDYGTSTLLVGQTAEGKVVKWFASGFKDYEAGDTLYLEAATVKAHDNYQGQDQTVLTRGKIAVGVGA